MLRVEPVRRIRSPNQREIAQIAQFPDNIPRTRSVRIVHLHQPVLVPDGNNQVAVVRRIDNCIGMYTVVKLHRLAIDVQVIEFIP